ncbi:MAG TPA: extracellular solute-binding protein [Chloroflexota bacterium]|jgi:ABC-type glycerol-3-phosphate transport system substrate-binding protein|nr:extracellular solute-binding protein [Chloroflexota bacterium]
MMRSARSALLTRRSLLARGALGGAALLLGDGALEQSSAAGDPFAAYPALNPAVINEHAHLNVWLAPELANHPAYRTAIGIFQRKYAHISVSVTPVAIGDIPTRLKIAVASSSNSVIPDLVSYHGYALGAQGLAQECDFLWAAWGQESAFLPAAMADVTWRLNKFGIPLVGNAVVTILNADLFERAHVSLPGAGTSFAQFTNAVSAVKRATGTPYGMILSGDPAIVTAVVHANGGSLLETQAISGRNLQLLSDSKVVDAVRFFTELGWRLHLAPIPPMVSNPLYTVQLFANRRAPAFFGTLSDLALINQLDNKLRVTVAPLPGGTTGRTSGSVNDGYSLVVVADPLFPQRHPHAAFELAKWLVARPPAIAVAESLHYAPTVTSYYNDPFFHRDANTAAYFAAARDAQPIALDAYPNAFDLYTQALRACFAGGDAARQLRAVAGQAQSFMDKADAGLDADG